MVVYSNEKKNKKKKMNILNPLTLLIIPIIGSLVIISFPSSSYYSNKESSTLAKTAQPPKVVSSNKVEELVPSLIELLHMAVTVKKNSNLKKIAIITSLINFIVSILF